MCWTSECCALNHMTRSTASLETHFIHSIFCASLNCRQSMQKHASYITQKTSNKRGDTNLIQANKLPDKPVSFCSLNSNSNLLHCIRKFIKTIHSHRWSSRSDWCLGTSTFFMLNNIFCTIQHTTST